MRKILVLLFVVSLISACNKNDDDTITVSDLRLNLNSLETLGTDYVYEGWIIVDGSPISTGVFTSVSFLQVFELDSDDLENATAFVLSIEPEVDPDPAPDSTKVLRGIFNGNITFVTTEIVGDFSNTTGSFFLRIPTEETGTNSGNDQLYYGLVFLECHLHQTFLCQYYHVDGLMKVR